MESGLPLPTYDFTALDLEPLMIDGLSHRFKSEVESLKSSIDDSVHFCLGAEVNIESYTIGTLSDDVVTPASYSYDDALSRLLEIQMNFYCPKGYKAFREGKETNVHDALLQETTVGVLATKLAIDLNKEDMIGIHVFTEEKYDYIEENYPDLMEAGLVRRDVDRDYERLLLFKKPDGLAMTTDKITLGDIELEVCGAGNRQKIFEDQYQSTDLAYLVRGMHRCSKVTGHIQDIAEPPEFVSEALFKAA
ncbi:MAG: hypothetical protein VW879_11890 [Opitutae bacterium]